LGSSAIIIIIIIIIIIMRMMISGFRRSARSSLFWDVTKFLPTFRDNLSVLPSTDKQSSWTQPENIPQRSSGTDIRREVSGWESEREREKRGE
jgi:FtsZ-interacting cell division protein ZipA